MKYVHNNNKTYHFQIENSSNKPYSTSILNSAMMRVDKTIFQYLGQGPIRSKHLPKFCGGDLSFFCSLVELSGIGFLDNYIFLIHTNCSIAPTSKRI